MEVKEVNKKMEVKDIWETFNLELRQYVKRKVQDDNLVDDIVQEIFEKVIINIKRLNEVENMQEYLYKVARNTVIDSFRSRQSRLKESMTIEEVGDFEMNDKESESLNTIISSSCIKPFINKLPEKYRDALMMSDIENQSQKELAEKLDISYSGAKSRVQRGREKLKDLLQECCNFEYDSYGNLIESQSNNCGC